MSVASWMFEQRELIAGTESLVKIAALFVGGWWTWTAFVRKRVKYPSANVQHDVTMWSDSGQTFIHLTVRINNTGSVQLRVARGCAWIEQLVPLPLAVQENIDGGRDIVPPGRTDAVWTMLQKRDLPENYALEIEPGEVDHIDFDFTIDPMVRRVLIYSHIGNPMKKTGGWNLNTIHEVPENRLP